MGPKMSFYGWFVSPIGSSSSGCGAGARWCSLLPLQPVAPQWPEQEQPEEVGLPHSLQHGHQQPCQEASPPTVHQAWPGKNYTMLYPTVINVSRCQTLPLWIMSPQQTSSRAKTSWTRLTTTPRVEPNPEGREVRPFLLHDYTPPSLLCCAHNLCFCMTYLILDKKDILEVTLVCCLHLHCFRCAGCLSLSLGLTHFLPDG